MKVSVLGACGRIGLPLTWIIANAGHKVFAIDPQFTIGYKCQDPDMPFPYVEDGFKAANMKEWKEPFQKNVDFTSLYVNIDESDVIVVIIGTPVDGENNPRIENIVSLFKDVIIPRTKEGTLVILRSTVSPGVTDLIKNMYEEQRPFLREGVNYSLVFAPERVSQGHSIAETPELPQLIGAFSDSGFNKAKNFFRSLGVLIAMRLTPREAEYGKLITNMYRYVNIALANEFYMIAARQGVDAHKVITTANFNYPRMHMPLPGPNAAGPCLFKDGKLLVQDVPYGDLINVAFHINEGMPQFMFNLMMEKAQTDRIRIKTVVILGMSFKPGNDDIRFSASYKLKKILKKNGINVLEVDPYDPSKILRGTPQPTIKEIQSADAFVVMTPHIDVITYFIDVVSILGIDDEVIIVDGWKSITNKSTNGVYTVGDYKNWLKS